MHVKADAQKVDPCTGWRNYSTPKSLGAKIRNGQMDPQIHGQNGSEGPWLRSPFSLINCLARVDMFVICVLLCLRFQKIPLEPRFLSPGRLGWLGGWEAGWPAVKGLTDPFGTPIYTFRA